MNPVVFLALKDIKILFRDRMGFFFTLVWPLGLAILFGTMYGGGGSEGPRAIPVIIVDEDHSAVSSTFIDSLRAAPEIAVTVSSRHDALEAVRKAKAVAFVVLKKGFGEASQNPFWGEAPGVEIGADPSRSPEASMLEGILMKYAARRLQDFFTDRDIERKEIDRARNQLKKAHDMPKGLRASLENLFNSLEDVLSDEFPQGGDSSTTAQQRWRGFEPLKITRSEITIHRSGPTSAYVVTFPQGAAWALLAVSATFAVSIVRERTNGTLLRLLAAPLTQSHVLAGKALACFLATIVVVSALFVLGYIVFGVVPNSVPLLALAIVSSSIAFVGVMMLLSTLGKTEQSVGGASWGILIILSMFGGGMIPLFVMPTWMRNLGSVSPIKWAILAIEGAIWRQFSPQEMLNPCIVLIAIGLGAFAIGCSRNLQPWGRS